MINYTERLDKALRIATFAHRNQVRKSTDIPYIIHPFGVMVIASNVTEDEDILIACLMHDVLEDVDASIYDENKMREDFGDRVVAIVKDVTKDENEPDWLIRSNNYLHHLEFEACDEAVIVSASDKIHNLLSILIDYKTDGEALWDRFTTKSSADQLWWYESILAVITKRSVPTALSQKLADQITTIKSLLATT